jgi:hypothetical protein
VQPGASSLRRLLQMGARTCARLHWLACGEGDMGAVLAKAVLAGASGLQRGSGFRQLLLIGLSFIVLALSCQAQQNSNTLKAAQACTPGWGACPEGMCAPLGSDCCGSGRYCPPGAHCCGFTCCGADQACSRFGCIPADAVDCGEYFCNPGMKCASGWRACIANDVVDCGNGLYCAAGSFCCASGCCTR